VIVKSSTPEFDYPTGKDNVYANYYGVDGIDIHGAVWRTLFAWYLDDVNILLSRYIINDSRIMLHRNIQDRVQTIAPFLQLDHDPYVVISNGAALLDTGRLHHKRVVPLRPAAIQRRHQLHSQFGESGYRCL
jgi:uncharacterized membrane protein (UPF0182 family)